MPYKYLAIASKPFEASPKPKHLNILILLFSERLSNLPSILVKISNYNVISENYSNIKIII